MYGTPVIRNDKLYIGAYDGSVLWVARDGSAVSSLKFKTDGPIVGSVVIDGDTLYVGSSDGNVYALDLNVADLSRSLRDGWPFKTGGKVWSTPVVKDKVLYIASADHNLYAVDTESGNEIWRFETDAAILSTPLVANGKVYIGGCDRKFYAIAGATEDQRLAAKARESGSPSDMVKTEEDAAVFEAENWFWTQALAFNGQIWVGCLDQKVYVLDAETLEYTGEVQTGGMVYAPPVVMQGLVIVGSQDGMIYAINADTREFKAYAVDPKTEDVSESPEKPKNKPAPILAPLLVDEVGGIIYFHAQDGLHALYALRLSTKEILWSFRTDQISD
jgi:outer membrane protein assembly factor BamB